MLTVDYTLQTNLTSAGLYIGLAIICVSLLVGIIFNIFICKGFEFDKGFLIWKEHDSSCLRTYRIVGGFSCLSFRFFRLLYSRLFDRFYFSAYIANGERLLTVTNRVTFITILLMTLPMIGLSATFLYNKTNQDQTFFSAIDTILLGFIAMVLLTIDTAKDQSYFDNIKSSLPFLKYRNFD